MDADALSTMLYVMDSKSINDIIENISHAESLVIRVKDDGSFSKEFSSNFLKN